ncbi:TPA: ABC transporter substrate-binding protein [Burkholderia multivorans]|uniref:ABC transporter, periplasmic nitrate/sulfonate/taurine-binding protein n=1 Tax=Burkholderia multivorans CGD2 TaxID=513052 RepID=B9BP31_9BURK|nr:ABC transporter substrate-binding protein [Burkholderia multivorans]EEE07349.1 ABC transporter, periplasmic nitrate/sulfonate/taurine-binding protein [Burkholderia multivorans CGD2]EEE13720.1 ABC transporter, periplasmic nitrate/sulfonate/taurine-binding protein [Burkholderia multivorans CGD2M]PRH21101.1 ABC transporter substrate-binding protein [Burkholderia multivorans]HEM7842887.1 ABC transporter substrate-binding protein [Burkholderia multivorans]HEM7872727.1 ABC transporter substrate-b
MNHFPPRLLKAARHPRTTWRRRFRLHAAYIACVLAAGATGAQAATPFTLVTNWYAQAEHGGFYQAQAEGLYKSAGLDVTLRMGGPQVNAVQLLAANTAQCIISDDISTMNARAHGVPIKLVATSFQHDPTVLIAHDDVPDLKALRTRTLLASSNAYASWLPWAKSTLGFKDDQVRPYTFNLQPFMSSEKIAQQGYLTSEPFALAQAGVKFKVFALSDAGYPPYGNAIACRSDVIEQHPDEVAAFLRASMQGWKDYLSNPAAGNVLIRKENPNMSEAQLTWAVGQLKSSGLVMGGDAVKGGIGVITEPRLKASWNMAVKQGLIDGKAVPLDQWYTTSLITRHPVLP